MAVKVHSANIQDRDGAKLLLSPLIGGFPRMQLLWADSAYAGRLVEWIKEVLGWKVEVIKRLGMGSGDTPEGEPQASAHKGFIVQPRRWVVERTQSQNP